MHNAIQLFSGPDFKRDVYEALGIVVHDLRAGRVTKQQAVATMSKKHRASGAALQGWLSFGVALASFMWVVGGDILRWREQPQSNMNIEQVTAAAVEGYLRGIADQPASVSDQAEQPQRKPALQFPPYSKSEQKNRKQRRAEQAEQRRNGR